MEFKLFYWKRKYTVLVQCLHKSCNLITWSLIKSHCLVLQVWYIHTPSPPGLVSHWKFWWGAGLRDQNLCDTQGGGRFNSTNPQRRNTDIFSIDTLYALVVGYNPDPHPHNQLESFSISTYNLPVSSLNNLSGSFLLDTVQHGHQTWVGRGDFEIQKTGSNKTHMMMKIMTPH